MVPKWFQNKARNNDAERFVLGAEEVNDVLRDFTIAAGVSRMRSSLSPLRFASWSVMRRMSG